MGWSGLEGYSGSWCVDFVVDSKLLSSVLSSNNLRGEETFMAMAPNLSSHCKSVRLSLRTSVGRNGVDTQLWSSADIRSSKVARCKRLCKTLCTTWQINRADCPLEIVGRSKPNKHKNEGSVHKGKSNRKAWPMAVADAKSRGGNSWLDTSQQRRHGRNQGVVGYTVIHQQHEKLTSLIARSGRQLGASGQRCPQQDLFPARPGVADKKYGWSRQEQGRYKQLASCCNNFATFDLIQTRDLSVFILQVLCKQAKQLNPGSLASLLVHRLANN